MNRPKFKQVRELVRQGLVHAVCVYDLDRLSRRLAHQLLLSEGFEQAGVALRIVTMPDDAKTPEADMLKNMRGVFAEYERSKTLERTARGRRGRVRAGNPPYGRRTLGYTYVKHVAPDKGAHFEVHHEEAALVQRILRLYVEKGRSRDAIAAVLTAEGVPTYTDQRRTLPVHVWHPSSIGAMLRNTAYVGTLYEGKTQNLPGKSNPDKKTRHRRVPKEEWIPIAVPPIIDPATFEAAQALRLRNRTQSTRNRKHDYLFVSGRLRCGQCGCAMYGTLNPAGYAGYRCNRPAFQDVVTPHRRRSVQATAVEPAVWDAVQRVLKNPAVITAELARRREGTSTQQADLDRERHHYARQLAQCDKDVQRWGAAYLAEAIDLADFKAKKAEVDARRISAEQELERLMTRQRVLEQVELETATLTDYCRRVARNLHRFDLAEKRTALEALHITVVWHPDNPLEIRGSIPVAIATNTPNWTTAWSTRTTRG